jgi:hypothetical protein
LNAFLFDSVNLLIVPVANLFYQGRGDSSSFSMSGELAKKIHDTLTAKGRLFRIEEYKEHY